MSISTAVDGLCNETLKAIDEVKDYAVKAMNELAEQKQTEIDKLKAENKALQLYKNLAQEHKLSMFEDIAAMMEWKKAAESMSKKLAVAKAECEELKRQIAEERECIEQYRIGCLEGNRQLAEKDAEVKRLNKNLLWSMQCTVESEAREAKLRVAIEKLEYAFKDGTEQDFVDAFAEVAAIRFDTSVLRDMVAKAGEVMRERVINRPFALGEVEKHQIRALPGVTLDDIQK